MRDDASPLRVSLIGLYSSKYPAIGETHALSVLAAVAVNALEVDAVDVSVLDMVVTSQEAVEPVLEFIRQSKPHILGMSVAYGTIDFLFHEYHTIKEMVGPDCWIVLGGPLPTSLTEIVLEKIPDAIIVVGEGEVSFAQIVQLRFTGGKFGLESIPGVAFVQDGLILRTPRVLTNLEKVPPPIRIHIPKILAAGGQIYTEASRGCSWSSCRFCLRGLTDVRGISKEYRTFPLERLRSDLHELFALGVRHFTFADEDFLGTDIDHARWVCDTLENILKTDNPLSFDASIMPHSVSSVRMSDAEIIERKSLIGRLKRIGLRKAFLGVESGSPSQLRRYAKGHSRSDAQSAIEVLRSEAVEIEVGWIMFDPLCSLNELADNISFLDSLGLVDSVSYPFAELRLQVGARYLPLLDRAEKDRGRLLYDRTISLNTASYEYQYLDPEVDRVVAEIRRWSQRIRPIHYPLKSLTRFAGSAIEQYRIEARCILRNLRVSVFKTFERFINESRTGTVEDAAHRAWELVEDASGDAIFALAPLLRAASNESRQHIIISNLITVTEGWTRQRHPSG